MMSFRTIDKASYSRQIKCVFLAICAYMLLIALSTSTLLIYFFETDGDNFWFNIAGVLIAVSGLLIIYHQVKGQPYLQDIIYIRAIKAQLNYIYRKQHKLKIAAQQGDAIAMAILDYNYSACAFIFELDDNTLTMEELHLARAELLTWREQYNISSLVSFSTDLLDSY